MDEINVWKTAVGEIEVELGRNQTRLYFGKTSIGKIDNGVVTISVPNLITRETLEKRYYSLIQQSLERQLKIRPSLLFEINKAVVETPGPLFEKMADKPETAEPEVNWAQEVSYAKTKLNQKYCFNTLVVGSTNNLAHAAAMRICQNPGKEYNPFFLYGGVGVGKTHLMQAVGNELFRKNHSLRILYTTGENYMNDFVASLQEKTMSTFKKRYRDIDVLLVDDIQFISNKEAIQDEFFHTFNSLFMAEKQIVLTSDRPPEEIKVEDRLLSRLMGGLATDIQSPDLEMRMAIILEKLRTRNVQWPSEVVEYFASRYQQNIREIEGAIQKILAHSAATNEEVNLTFVRHELGGENGRQQGQPFPSFISPKQVISAVSKIFGVKTVEILSDKRDAQLSFPRQVVMYILRKECRLKLEEIAQFTNRKDHTTVLHGVAKIEALYPQNIHLRQQIMLIKKELWG